MKKRNRLLNESMRYMREHEDLHAAWWDALQKPALLQGEILERYDDYHV